jgi:hypothetical protein
VLRFAPSGNSAEYFNNYANRISSSGTTATNSRYWPGGADLRGVDLRNADLGLLHLYRTDFGHADLSGAHMDAPAFRDSDLRLAELTGAVFLVRLFFGAIHVKRPWESMKVGDLLEAQQLDSQITRQGGPDRVKARSTSLDDAAAGRETP